MAAGSGPGTAITGTPVPVAAATQVPRLITSANLGRTPVGIGSETGVDFPTDDLSASPASEEGAPAASEAQAPAAVGLAGPQSPPAAPPEQLMPGQDRGGILMWVVMAIFAGLVLAGGGYYFTRVRGRSPSGSGRYYSRVRGQ